MSIGGLVSVGLGLGLGLKSPARAEEGKYERTKLGVPYEEVYGETKRSPPLCWPTPPTSPSQRPNGVSRGPPQLLTFIFCFLGFLFDQVGTNALDSRVVQVGDDVLIDYVMRRSNGYFMVSRWDDLWTILLTEPNSSHLTQLRNRGRRLVSALGRPRGALLLQGG